MRCASVRKKGSLDQCPVAPVYGHTLCGRHARCKKPVLWVDVHRTRHAGLVRAQALIRGYLVRTRLALGGVGVLRRKGLTNDEDLVTLTETSCIDPFHYISVTESDKTWAFEFPTLFTWTLQSETPVNPYTKVPLSHDTQTRLFRMWTYRLRHRETTTVLSFHEACRLLAQVFQSKGFADIGASSFATVPKVVWGRVFRLLQQEFLAAYPLDSLVRRRGLLQCRRMEAMFPALSAPQYCQTAASTLLRILVVPRDPYLVCFSILSCFFRC